MLTRAALIHLAAPGEKEGATQPIDQNYTEDNFRQLGVTIEATATFLDGFGDLAMGCAVVEFPTRDRRTASPLSTPRCCPRSFFEGDFMTLDDAPYRLRCATPRIENTLPI